MTVCPSVSRQARSCYMIPHLVGVFDQNILALRHFHAKVCNRSDNSPPVSNGDVELSCEIGRAHGCRAQNDMASVVLGIGP